MRVQCLEGRKARGCLHGKCLPVAGVLEVQETGYGEGYEPESYDRRADGDDESAGATIVGMGGCAAPDTEDLSEESDEKNYAAENKGEPCHGHPLYSFSHRVEKRDVCRRRGVPFR
jgi:hypothetical protein